MTRRILSIATLVLALAASAHADYNISTFEDVGLTTPNSYFNAAPNLTDPNYSTGGQFVSGGNSFANSYTYYPGYGGSWSGWAISNQTFSALPPYTNQNSTPDYNYQYMSATGSGANGSATYAVAYTGGDGTPGSGSGSVVNLAPGSSPVSMQVTNTEYDVLSMTYGDSFASPFGANNYLVLNIFGYSGLNGMGNEVGEIQIYLAQGLSILTTWETVDLTGLAGSQSLVFGTISNDDNSFGDAIPTSFALDNLTAFTPGVVPEPSSLVLCLGGIGIGIGSLVLRRVRSRKGLL